MSCTTIKAVWSGEKAESLHTLRNSWRAAPFFWKAICDRYLDEGVSMWDNNGAAIWALVDRADIPRSARAVLLMTCDGAILRKEDYPRAASDIDEVVRCLSLADSHWPQIADLLRSDPDCPAIGFYWTSVGEDPFHGDWNEDADRYDPPDWSKLWSVYEHASLSPGVDTSAGSP